MDKIIIRTGLLILSIFLLIAVLYERPEKTVKSAGYLPEKGFNADAMAGHALFTKHCINCHGQNLEGTDKGPSLLHAYYRPDHHADVAFYLAVAKGVQQHHWQFGNMPSIDNVSPEQVAHIIKYVRERQRKAGLY